MEKNKIGLFIANKRKEKGLTQQELGNILYVTDKAISKWERGLSLPDITLLTKLAKTLDVSVNDILNGEKTDKNIDIETKLAKIKKEMNDNHHKNKIKLLTIIIILIIILLSIIIINISFGYKNIIVDYNHANTPKKIEIGIPKTSFLMNYHDKSYSFKNIRNKSILENEIKKYLKSLTYKTCNNTIYYYNETYDYSITNYSVTNHLFYNTISYTIANYDFCNNQKINEYTSKLGALKIVHSMNESYSLNDSWQQLLIITFIDGYDDGTDKDLIYSFKAKLDVKLLKRTSNNETNTYILESSIGDIDIKDDKLYYYRTNIINKNDDINIPEVSVFKISDGSLILTDNYLSKYHKDEIILK